MATERSVFTFAQTRPATPIKSYMQATQSSSPGWVACSFSSPRGTPARRMPHRLRKHLSTGRAYPGYRNVPHAILTYDSTYVNIDDLVPAYKPSKAALQSADQTAASRGYRCMHGEGDRAI